MKGPPDSMAGIDPELAADLISRLIAAGRTVALAESLTGGLASAVLTSVPGASAVVRGGLVVYATDLKASLLAVDAGLLERNGAVDPEVARQLAAGVRRVCGADIGIGLTGAAGPGWADGKPPGTYYVALAGPGRAGVPVDLLRAEQVPGDRSQVRAAAVRTALDLLAEYLGRRPEQPGTPAVTRAL